MYLQAADASTGARLEYAGPGAQVVTAFTPDGTCLLLVEDFKDLSLLRLTPPARVEPLRRTESNDWLGEVSPDGGWIAYESDEAGGRVDVFVRPFRDVNGRREQISTGGGRYAPAAWSTSRPAARNAASMAAIAAGAACALAASAYGMTAECDGACGRS